jgi:hypothetical protein
MSRGFSCTSSGYWQNISILTSCLQFPFLTAKLVDHISYTLVFILILFVPLLGTVGLFVCDQHYAQPTSSGLT